MTRAKCHSADADIQASMKAMARAARAARHLAETTGTPLYVMKGGRVVNLNRGARRRRVGAAA